MGLEIGKIIRHVIQRNRDATTDSRMYEVQFDEDEDTQEVQAFSPAGFQSRAPLDSNGITGRISAAFKALIGFDDGVAPLTIDPGETVVYASSSGSAACKIHCKNDGSIEVTVPGDLNIIGNMTVSGTVDAVGDISSEADVISASAGSAVSLTDHFHIGNLGYNTDTPIPIGSAGTPPPASPPSATGGDLDMNGNDVVNISGGTNYSTHVHAQGADSNGDTEVDTDPPT